MSQNLTPAEVTKINKNYKEIAKELTVIFGVPTSYSYISNSRGKHGEFNVERYADFLLSSIKIESIKEVIGSIKFSLGFLIDNDNRAMFLYRKIAKEEPDCEPLTEMPVAKVKQYKI
jgi:hypothetical protein